MSIEIKIDNNAGYITSRQVEALIDCGIADWKDFRQRKQYDEFIFAGDKNDLFITDFHRLQELHGFIVTIERDCIAIK